MVINLVNKDEDLAKYIKDNDSLTRTKNFNKLAINMDLLIDKSASLKQIELCRPISGIKKLIYMQTFRKESPDSTFCEMDSKGTFDDSKIVSNDNALNTNNSKFLKNESLKKIEDSLFLPSPQKKTRESSLFNSHTIKKEYLVPSNKKIEVIAEEEINEFLLTGMKFNSQIKPINSIYNNFETENQKVPNKKYKENILPPLDKRTSSILNQNIRSNLLFSKNDTNKENNIQEGKLKLIEFYNFISQLKFFK